METIVAMIRRKNIKGMNAETIADLFELDKDYVEQIVNLLQTNPNSTDTEIAQKLL